MKFGDYASLGLLIYSNFAGSKKNHLYFALLLVFFFFILALQVNLLEKNLYKKINVQPDLKNTILLRKAYIILERKDKDLAAEIKPLLKDEARKRYLTYGPRGLIQLKNDTDGFEFFVEILGPTALWYLVSSIVVFAFSSRKSNSGTLMWGLVSLIVFFLYEFSQKEKYTFEPLKSFPFMTLFEYIEFLRIFAAFFFSLVLYYFSFLNDDRNGQIILLSTFINDNYAKFLRKE